LQLHCHPVADVAPERPTLVPFPEKVMVQTISRCNAACAFCPYPALGPTLPQGVMEESLFRRIIDECGEHAVQRLMPYLMNEPLMDPQLIPRINYARARNPAASIHILTNGSLLTPRRADELIDSGLDWVGISVHGFSPGAYHVATGLRREVTYERVEGFIERAIARRGADFVMVTFNGGGAVTSQEREAELTHFRRLGVRRISYFGQSISRAGNVPGISAPHHQRVMGCRSIWWPEMVHVLYSGDVILCCMDWGRQAVVGNVREHAIHELWHSDRYRVARDRVWGAAPDQADQAADWPCHHCEEAIVEPLVSPRMVDAALVVLPCAMLDSDASMVPGVQLSLRSFGVEETLLDLSAMVYARLDEHHGYLWRRAGHGVVYHGDPSFELMSCAPDEIEWCVARTRELAASHLVFPLVRASHTLTQEVVRRIRERDPERSILVYGSEEQPSQLLRELGVPYRRYDNCRKTAEWIARQAGRSSGNVSPESAASVTSLAAVDEEWPVPTEPPWRPPGWEGTGAGMIAPDAAESAAGVVTRWIDSLGALAVTSSRVWRHPLSASRELTRGLRATAASLARLVAPNQNAAAAVCDGVPGCITLEPLAATRLHRNRAEPMVADPDPEPAAPESCGPWQRRPDQHRPVDLLLTTLPPWGFNNPPVGLAHLATHVRHHGHAVELLDLNIDLYHRLGPGWELLWHVENKNYWSNETTFGLLLELLGPHLDAYADLIADHPAPLVGLSVVDPKERCTIELIRRVRQRAPHKRILLGGPACVTPEYRRIFTDTIPELVDGYVLGEGEQTLCEVIDAVRAQVADLSGIPGVLCHRDGQDLPFARRQRLIPLDDVLFPGYEDFDFERYPGDELIVEWSRGCIGSCSFCKGKMIDGRYRTHSAAAIVRSLKHYVEHLGVRKFTVCDPVINGDVEVLAELCRRIEAENLGAEWRGEAIPHAGLTAQLLQAMRRAGCVELQLGVESGSDRVLELMKKRRLFCAADAARVVRDCHEAGIRTALFIIIGFPGEGEQEFLETCRFVDENAAYIDELKSINSMHIITDTPVHMHPERYNLCLPEVDYHYRWSTTDGQNTTDVRNDRIRWLMEIAAGHGIHVRETNLAEGKQGDLVEQLQGTQVGQQELLEVLQRQVTAIRSV